MRVVVAGAGIAGLAAAWALSGQPDVEVVVRDPAGPGGKLRTSTFDGRPVDEGPDAFLTRVPEAVQLCGELGMAADLVAPAAGRSMLWWAGRLRPLPDGLVLGVPGRVGALARSGILSPLGALRAGLDLVLPRRRAGSDVSVRQLVAARFGAEVADRLVDPLVGGIHAGRTDRLSAAATVPQLVAAAGSSRSLLRGLSTQTPGSGAAGPVFLAPPGGLGELVGRLVGALEARGVRIEPSGVAAVGPARGGGVEVDGDRADAVVLAVPAPAAARLLAGAAPTAAAALGAVEHASVALTTLAFDAAAVELPAGVNGYLVPRPEGRLTTAVSFASAKWPHWGAPGRVVLRVSAGRHLDDRAGSLGDDDLVGRLVGELGEALGRSLPAPAAARVTRWPAAFPQYTVGHLERVAALEASLAGELPGVALAGAALRGSGIPACIASGRRAAAAVLGPVRARR